MRHRPFVLRVGRQAGNDSELWVSRRGEGECAVAAGVVGDEDAFLGGEGGVVYWRGEGLGGGLLGEGVLGGWEAGKERESVVGRWGELVELVGGKGEI